MELKELEYIVTIAEEGSISKAAQRLYMGQSSLSQYLSRYEAELNTKLFVRTGSGVRTTSAGAIFVANARQMLQQFRRVQSEIQEADLPKSGTISFGISTFRGCSLIPPLLERFHQAYPSVNVVFSEHHSAVLKKKVAAGELDMALIAQPSGEECPENAVVMQDEVCLIASRTHPVMQYAHYGQGPRPWIDLSNTAEFEYLLSDRTTVLGNVAHIEFEKHDIHPPIVNDNLSAFFAESLASQGMGLAFTYGSCAKPNKYVEYFSLGKERYFVDILLIFPPHGYRNRANRAMEEMIREIYRI